MTIGSTGSAMLGIPSIPSSSASASETLYFSRSFSKRMGLVSTPANMPTSGVIAAIGPRRSPTRWR